MENLAYRKSYRVGMWFLAVAIMATIFTGTLAPTSVKAESPAAWENQQVSASSYSCIDGTRPNTLYSFALEGEPSGIYQVNWVTKQRTKLNSYSLSCEGSDLKHGIFYANNPQDGKIYRFTTTDLLGQAVTKYPYYGGISKDGSVRYFAVPGGMYSIDGANNNYRGSFSISEDAGLNWQERGQQFSGKIGSAAIVEGDSRSVYILVREDQPDGQIKSSIYYTADAGISWAKRYEVIHPAERSMFLHSVWGRTAPVTSVLLYEYNDQTDYLKVSLTTNGASSFQEAAYFQPGLLPIDDTIKIFHTGTAYLRAFSSYNFVNPFALSQDNGQSWQTRTSIPNTMVKNTLQNENMPSYILAHGVGGWWFTTDGAGTWQPLPAGAGDYLRISPYSPTVLVAAPDIKTLNLSGADKAQTEGVNPKNTPGGNYYPQTKHNISPLFQKYWDEKGGLFIFGYPKTEAFFEYNPTDGKFYMVQYFERNRFEYHPENLGTPYEVLLGLLGNQLTETRRANGEGAFNRFDNKNYPGGTYFPETGHNLRNSFKAYWENNGGLFIFGYPTSEEFTEVNPDDGKTYVVQYFERNRFEYHPENTGTPFEVLLGLLGNSLLKQKGWL